MKHGFHAVAASVTVYAGSPGDDCDVIDRAVAGQELHCDVMGGVDIVLTGSRDVHPQEQATGPGHTTCTQENKD